MVEVPHTEGARKSRRHLRSKDDGLLEVPNGIDKGVDDGELPIALVVCRRVLGNEYEVCGVRMV